LDYFIISIGINGPDTLSGYIAQQQNGKGSRWLPFPF
jgi:hypothetical protein